MKERILRFAKMCHAENDRELMTEMQMQIDSLSEQVAHYKVKCEDLQHELDFYKLSDEDKVKYLMEDVTETEELYQKRIHEYELMTQLARKDIEAAEESYHRRFAEGRMCAYSEMGIWRLDALERDNVLVMDREGNVFELITGLEDVTADADNMQTTDDEITIDDLVEV